MNEDRRCVRCSGTAWGVIAINILLQLAYVLYAALAERVRNAHIKVITFFGQTVVCEQLWPQRQLPTTCV